MRDPWIRSGVIVGITDGDSVKANLDLGYRVWHATKVRLIGIDAPERGEVGWADARDYLADLLPAGAPVTVRTTGPDKYGDRWNGEVLLPDGRSVGALMLAAGLALPSER